MSSSKPEFFDDVAHISYLQKLLQLQTTLFISIADELLKLD